MYFFGKISKNYSYEVGLFDYTKGLHKGQLIDFSVFCHYKQVWDHTPDLNITISILSLTIFHLEIYNINHAPEIPEEYWETIEGLKEQIDENEKYLKEAVEKLSSKIKNYYKIIKTKV